MSIPQEAIEAAAKALWNHHQATADDNDAILVSVTDPPLDEFVCCATAALEAAAPFLREAE